MVWTLAFPLVMVVLLTSSETFSEKDEFRVFRKDRPDGKENPCWALLA